jgi:hypothetical protein
MEYCAQAVVAMLKRPDFGKNQRIFLSPFEASQRQIVAELERVLGVEFAEEHVDDGKLVQDAQSGWEEDWDINFAYQLVTAGVLLPEYKSGFESAGKKPILEHEIETPKFTLEGVLNHWLSAHAGGAVPWKDERFG